MLCALERGLISLDDPISLWLENVPADKQEITLRLKNILANKGGEMNIHATAFVTLSAGEQISMSLLAMAIEKIGCPVVSLTGWQAGIHTDSVHGNAKICSIDADRTRQELESGKIVVVAGFQGINDAGDVTTLGRGGSDTTAVALAAALRADKCQIFTDVDGVYDRDPRLYADARKFARIGYEDMLTLVENGAQVLHDRSVITARESGLKIEVLSAFTDTPGTVVG